MEIGDPLSSVRVPIFLVLDNQNSPLPQVNLTVRVIGFTESKSDFHPSCNSEYLHQIKFTQEYYRTFAYCIPEFTYIWNISNSDGRASFTNFTMVRGPAGVYKFEAVAQYRHHVVKSQEFQIYYKSKVSRIEMKNRAPAFLSRANYSSMAQPELYVYDALGKPLKGKRAVLFSWVTPITNNQLAFPYLKSGDKQVLIENQYSELSDENGKIVFNNARIVGSNYKAAFLQIAVNSLVVPWTDEPFRVNEHNTYFRQKSTTYFQDEHYKFTFLDGIKTNVTENEDWEVAVIVTDSQGNAVAGVPVFLAILDYTVGSYIMNNYYQILPEMYSLYETAQWLSSSKIRSKQLTCPISAHCEEPAYRDNLKMPKFYYTNSSGVAVLNPKFNSDGFAGTYQVVISSTNNFTTVAKNYLQVNVQTSIKEVKVVQDPPSQVEMSQILLRKEQSYDFLVVFQLLGEKSVRENHKERKEIIGIQGKAPFSIRVVSWDNLLNSLQECKTAKVRLIDSNPLFTPSSFHGYITLPLKMIYTGQMTLKTQNISIEVVFDNQTVYTPFFELVNYINTAPTEPAQIDLTCPLVVSPPAYTNGFSAKVFDIWNTPIYNTTVKLRMISVSQIGLPFHYLPTFSGLSATTNASGSAEWNNIRVTNSVPGTFAMQAYLPDYPEVVSPNCQVILNMPFFEFSTDFDTYNIELDKDYQFNFKTSSGLPSSRFPSIGIPLSQISISWLYYPPIQHFYRQSDPLYGVTISGTKGFYADSDDIFFFNMKFKPGAVGEYGFVFTIYGISSNPVHVKTNFPPAKVDVIQNPEFKELPFPTSKYFTKGPYIKVTDSLGNPLADYPVIIIPVGVNSSVVQLTMGSFSNLKLSNPQERLSLQFSGIQGSSVARTNSSGIAHQQFTYVMGTDTIGYCKFQYLVGDLNQFILSEATPVYAFKSSIKLELYEQYSDYISYDQKFPQPLKTRVLFNLGYFPLMFGLIASVRSYNNKIVTSPIEESAGLLQSPLCIIKLDSFSANPKFESHNCKVEITSAIPPMSISVEFTNLYWRVPGVQARIQLGVSTMVNALSNTSVVTKDIQVQDIPKNLYFLSQPPSQAYVDSYFSFKVKATIQDGSALPGIPVDCNFSTYLHPSLMNTYIFSSLASHSLDLQTLAEIASDRNAVLDPMLTRAVTDDDGVATLNMKFLTGLDQRVQIQCSSSGIKTPLSNPMNLTTNIQRVVMSNSTLQNQNVKFLTDSSGNFSPKRLYVEYGAQMTIFDKSGKPVEGLEDNIEIFLVTITPALEPHIAANANLNLTFSEMQRASQMNITDIKTVGAKLFAFAEVLTQGVSTAYQIKAQLSNPDVTAELIETCGPGCYQPVDLNIEIPGPGTYSLLYMVRGVETIVTSDTTFTITATTTIRNLATVTMTVLVFAMYGFTTLAAGKEWNALWGIPILILSGASIFFYYLSKHALSDLSYMTLFLDVFIGFFSVYIIVKHCCKDKKHYEEAHWFYERKKEIFYEYTYQKLFSNVSKIWSNKNIKDIPMHHEDGEAYHEEQTRIIKLASERNYPTSDAAGEITETQEELSEVIKKYREETKAKRQERKLQSIQDPSQFLEDPEKAGICTKFKRIFTPFYVQNRGKYVVDAVYFPQRFVTPVVISLVSVVLLSFGALTVAAEISASVLGLAQLVNRSVNTYLNAGSSEYYQLFNHDVSDHELAPFSKLLTMFTKYLSSFAWAISIGVYVGIVLATICVIANIIFVMFDFKNRVIKTRKGTDKTVMSFDLPASMTFAGLYISFVMITFLLAVLFCSGIASVLLWDLVWELLWTYKWTIVVLLSMPWAQGKTYDMIQEYAISKKEISHRRFLSYLEIVLFYEGIIAGIAASIGRFTNGIVVLILGITRIDMPAYPQWVLNISYLDSFNASYYSIIHIYSIYNNPIFSTYKNILIDIGKEKAALREEEDEEKKKLIDEEVAGEKGPRNPKWLLARNRWHIARLLMIHPELAQYRSKVCMEKVRLREEEEAKGKQDKTEEIKEKEKDGVVSIN